MLSNIPQELRSLRQWVAANAKKEPINPRTGKLASVTDPATWGSFEEAKAAGHPSVGFVLSSSDPYAIIDLDDKPHKPLTLEERTRHQAILAAFDTYTERSQSGRGYHIVARGVLPKGVHRDSVEIYSSERYMIFTGNVVKPRPILEHQALLTQMYEQMAPRSSVSLVELDEVLTDEDIVDLAMSASNSDKFNSLARGEMHEYPSQSEADLALLSIIAFYTPSNEQVRRLFRYSALGKREKAVKNDRYLDFAIELIRSKAPPPIEWEPAQIEAPPVQEVYVPIPVTIPEPLFPPGLVGDIARYSYATANRPVAEVSLAAALGFIAGIVGRSYNISHTGLNQYIMLLARTGAGKEEISNLPDRLLAAIRPNVPMADQFLGPAAFASGQALVRHLAEKPCFVAIMNDFGLTLQTMSDKRAPGPLVMLKKALLNIYAKSGHSSMLRSSIYSDSEKNTKLVSAPNVTLLCDSPPDVFFDGLSEANIVEGLVPRFLIINYEGPRTPRNPNYGQAPDQGLTQRLIDLVMIAVSTAQNASCCQVQSTADAQASLDAFDKKADALMNSQLGNVAIELWNRAHLKAIKLAGLIAVGVDPHNPTITPEIAEWAIHRINLDIEFIMARFAAGDVGEGDGKQTADLKKVIASYIKDPAKAAKTYQTLPSLALAGLIPWGYLSRRTISAASFKNDKRGATQALKSSVQNMIANGELIEVDTKALREKYNYSGQAYRVGTM